LQQNRSGGVSDYLEEIGIDELDVEREELIIKRQEILDERNGWKQKFFWSVLIPSLISVVSSMFYNIIFT